MLTPEMTASSGSPPAARTEYAFSTALMPFADAMTTGRVPPACRAGWVLTCAAIGSRTAPLIKSRRLVGLIRISYGPFPSLFVWQLGLLGDGSLRSGREQIHHQVGEGLGELTARQDPGHAGRLRTASQVAIHVGEESDDGQLPRRRVFPQLADRFERLAVGGEIQQHGGARAVAAGLQQLPGLRETDGYVQVPRG